MSQTQPTHLGVHQVKKKKEKKGGKGHQARANAVLEPSAGGCRWVAPRSPWRSGACCSRAAAPAPSAAPSSAAPPAARRRTRKRVTKRATKHVMDAKRVTKRTRKSRGRRPFGESTAPVGTAASQAVCNCARILHAFASKPSFPASNKKKTQKSTVSTFPSMTGSTGVSTSTATQTSTHPNTSNKKRRRKDLVHLVHALGEGGALLFEALLARRRPALRPIRALQYRCGHPQTRWRLALARLSTCAQRQDCTRGHFAPAWLSTHAQTLYCTDA
eukprot:25238-Rhodomonas_salina.1